MTCTYNNNNTYLKSPRHPRQKYLLTVKGMGLYNLMNGKEGEV